MTKNPTSAEVITPIRNGGVRAALVRWRSFSKPAPTIIGVDNRKENRAASSRVSPKKSPLAMVMPERETPGIIANACERPMVKLWPKEIVSLCWRLAP